MMNLNLAEHPCYYYTGARSLEPGRPTVVFIHGAGHDHSVWTLQTRYFASHGWNVVAPDLPGHGCSGGPALASIEAPADWVLALLGALEAVERHHQRCDAPRACVPLRKPRIVIHQPTERCLHDGEGGCTRGARRLHVVAALGLGRHDLIQREPDALPASQVLGQAGEVLAVLLAHPSQGRLSVGEPVRGARWVRVNVLFKHLRGDVPSPPGCAPDLQRREAGEGLLCLLRGPDLDLDASPVGPVQVGVFGLQALFVEPHTHRAALAAHVQGAALLREIVPVPGLAPHDSALLLDLDGWP